MRKMLFVSAVALVLVGLVAGPAWAGRVSVNAARNVVRYNSTEFAYVSVDEYAGEITMIGAALGQAPSVAWFTVRVSGVGAGALTATAFGTGDCTGKTVSVKRKAGDVAIVRVSHTGDFNCTYKSVTVRWP